VLSLLVDGSIQPVLARTMPLGEAAAAQRLLEDGSGHRQDRAHHQRTR
jgi:NADPH:quinone reductase-like Zn-dependent oxidoreductase